MARTSQVPPRGTRRYWRQFKFLDHAGKQVTLGRMYSTDPNRPPDPDTSFSFQVYSLIQLDSDHTKLLEYLTSGFDWDLIPTFEIYAEQQPDVFSCVEHQRREIAHRKVSRDTSMNESLPLIAKVAAARYDSRRQGFLIVITSDSYRVGFLRPDQEPGSWPLWAHFNRKFPYRTIVDRTSRLSGNPYDYLYQGVPDEEGIEVWPEAIEISVRRIQLIGTMQNELQMLYHKSFKHVDGELEVDYGLDEDEGQPNDPTGTAQAGDVLIHQAQALSLNDFQVTEGPGDAISIRSNNIMPSGPDLRYIIYAPFLLHYPDHSLDSTARALTSAITPHLPEGKTIQFEFYRPPDTSLSSIISFHRDLLRTRPDFQVGALHNISTPQPGNNEMIQSRVYPCLRREFPPFNTFMEEPYRVFAVVLDKLDFINETGVLFVLTDGGKQKPQMGIDVDYCETQVWRSGGMAEVARRLGMLILDEMEQRAT